MAKYKCSSALMQRSNTLSGAITHRTCCIACQIEIPEQLHSLRCKQTALRGVFGAICFTAGPQPVWHYEHFSPIQMGTMTLRLLLVIVHVEQPQSTL